MTSVPVSAVYEAAAAVVPSNVMHFLRDLRQQLVNHPAWNEGIAKALWLYGTDGTFDISTYVAHYSVHAFPAYMHFHVSTKNIHTHHIYVRVAGTLVWDAPISFDGANFDLHRVSTASENLEVMVVGVRNNVETPTASVITPVTYKGSI